VDINVEFRSTGQRVIVQKGNLGMVVLELAEAKQVLAKLPQAIKDAERGMTEEERQRQIKEHEEALVKLRAEPKAAESQPTIRMGRSKEGSGLGENKEKT
jgi:ribosomal protein L29